MSTFKFIKQVFLAPGTTGAIAPSSKALGRIMTDKAGVREAKVVVEFGPGNGVFTEVIAGELQANAHFFAVEINPDFAKAVRKRCPGVTVYEDSAANTGKYLREAGYETCDCIVSGLPFASFDDELQDELLSAVLEVLRPGGRFVTFTYVQSPLLSSGRRFHAKLEGLFEGVEKTPMVWCNLPPAFAYCAYR